MYPPVYFTNGKPWLLVVHQFLHAKYSSYNTLNVTCIIDHDPPPGSPSVTYSSWSKVKL